MVAEPKAATLDTFFTKISKEQAAQKHKEASARWEAEEKVRTVARNYARAEKERLQATLKRKPGRPRKSPQEANIATPKDLPVAKDEGAEDDATSDGEAHQPSQKKKRGNYTNWFQKDLWEEIMKAVKKYPKSLRDALAFLRQIRARGCVQSVFDKLNESTLRGWFVKNPVSDRWQLQEAIHESIIAQNARKATHKATPQGILSSRPETFHAIIQTLKELRDAGQPLNSGVVQAVMYGIIQERAPELFATKVSKKGSPGGQNFQVSRRFARKFVRKHLGWTWRRATTAASKLPADWEQQGQDMAYRFAATCERFNIPPSLVINFDQTAVYVRPCTDQTYEIRGAKDVKTLGKDEKRQIIAVVGSAADGTLLPLQLIFQGKTEAVLPKGEAARRVQQLGWDLTQTENHWSSQQSMERYLEEVLKPYFVKECLDRGLDPQKQKCIVALDCWKVHLSAGFREHVKERHPWVELRFVPANCTSKLQPADVVLQRPLKHRFCQQFNLWQMEEIRKQYKDGLRGKDIDVNKGIRELRDNLVKWLLVAWEELTEQREIIKRGWAKCGLGLILDPAFQVVAEQCLDRGLLAEASLREEEEPAEAQEYIAGQVEELPMQTALSDVLRACLGDNEIHRRIRAEGREEEAIAVELNEEMFDTDEMVEMFAFAN